MVGTDAELVTERQVGRNTIEALSGKWGVPFYEVSSKGNWRVTDPFEDLVRLMRRHCAEISAQNTSRKRSNSKCISM